MGHDSKPSRINLNLKPNGPFVDSFRANPIQYMTRDISNHYTQSYPQADFKNTRELDTIIIQENIDNISDMVRKLQEDVTDIDVLNEMIQPPFEKGRIKCKINDDVFWFAFWTNHDEISQLFHNATSALEDYSHLIGISVYRVLHGSCTCSSRTLFTPQYILQDNKRVFNHRALLLYDMVDYARTTDILNKESKQQFLQIFQSHDSQEYADLLHMAFLNIIIYLNLKIREEAETYYANAQLQQEDTNHIDNNTVSKKAQMVDADSTTKQKRNIIYIGNKIEIRKAKGSKITRSKILNRKCRKWSVRGHVRHYKSGKTVYIQPFEKGKDREKAQAKIKPKTYIVKANHKGDV